MQPVDAINHRDMPIAWPVTLSLVVCVPPAAGPPGERLRLVTLADKLSVVSVLRYLVYFSHTFLGA